MRYQLLIVLLLGLLFVSADARSGATNITGTWDLVYLGREGKPVKLKFVFKQTGEKLTGTHSGPFGTHPVTGTVKGDKALFGFDLKSPGSDTAFTVKFDGKIESATKLTGTVGDPFCAAGCKWTATKKK
jgi:hypothetical protein